MLLKRFYRFVLAVFLFSLFIIPSSTVNASGSVSGLHISGDKILNGANEQVQMQGVNRSSFEYSCLSSTTNFDGPADQAEVNAMRSWNINTVRLVLNEDCYLGLHNLPLSGAAKYQQDVASYVNLLTQNNIAVIINLHFNGDGNNDRYIILG